jgi:hypothetical protein
VLALHDDAARVGQVPLDRFQIVNARVVVFQLLAQFAKAGVAGLDGFQDFFGVHCVSFIQNWNLL